MAKEWAKSFYNSKAWKECRKAYIESVNNLCERCNNVGDILHHKTILTPKNINNNYITLGWDNLEFICQDCHNKEHHLNEYDVTRQDVQFDASGQLIKKI